ncbi:uncharacterized protein LOC121964635 [Plectropomus leopardus]|uniref:uncharacterized protein LOC121964635 n=1 Tax=Plectropomus leopardus TaxID=160734 RepID=UPI001C4CBBFA|nr:uncharacterized protein LOC121964635 [Plectropomus leopardus]
MVYGKKHYQGLTEGSSYCFRNLKEDEYGVKFTSDSRKSQTKAVDVHEELHTQAQRLIYPESPVSSVENALSSADRTEMSVEGTVTMINPVEKVQVKHKQEKTKKQTFHLEDKTGSIKICMWGDATKHCKDLSPDDVIKVTNVKTNRYFDTVSLDSTRDTHIHKVHSVGIQKVTMEIIGIVNANKKETHLDAHLESSPQLHTFVVASRLLAKAFDLKLDGDFKDSLLDKIPLPADAEIQGNKIKKITAAQEM